MWGSVFLLYSTVSKLALCSGKNIFIFQACSLYKYPWKKCSLEKKPSDSTSSLQDMQNVWETRGELSSPNSYHVWQTTQEVMLADISAFYVYHTTQVVNRNRPVKSQVWSLTRRINSTFLWKWLKNSLTYQQHLYKFH